MQMTMQPVDTNQPTNQGETMDNLQKIYDLIVTWQRAYSEPIPLAKLANMADISPLYARRLVCVLGDKGLIVVTQCVKIDAEAVA